jgi:hypothetical protein
MNNIHHSTHFELNGDMIFTSTVVTDDAEIAQVEVKVTMKSISAKSPEEMFQQALGLLCQDSPTA